MEGVHLPKRQMMGRGESCVWKLSTPWGFALADYVARPPGEVCSAWDQVQVSNLQGDPKDNLRPSLKLKPHFPRKKLKKEEFNKHK